MRDYEMDRRPRARVLAVIAVAAVGTLLGLASPAAADSRRAGDPLRFWSVSKIVQGAGAVPVQSGAQLGDKLQQYVDLGRVAFNLPLHAPYWFFLPRDRAFGSLFSSADGARYSVLAQAPTPTPIRPGAPKGAVTHLDEYRAYEKTSSDASLKIALSDLLLQTVDDNSKLVAWECPPRGTCEPIRTVVRFHARAYAASAGGEFFNTGGVAYLEGHQHSWRPGAATSADSSGPLWGEKQFRVDGDADDSGTGAGGVMFPTNAITVKVPLAAVRQGGLFGVHVTLEAEAVDDRGGESAAQAFIQDPQRGTGLLTAHGLKPRGRPRFQEPGVKLPPAASCPSGPRRHAGAVQLSSPAFAVEEASRSVIVLVTRSGGSRGRVSATVSTRGGTARAGRDFKPTTTRVTFASGESSPRFVEIPIREDHAAEYPEKFTVSLLHPRCGRLGARRNSAVTIFGDPQPPSTTPGGSRTFTIGGTVDGLQGAGLVLSNLGAAVPVSANGSFTLPGTHTSGEPYQVSVKTPPHNPDQVCTVNNGTGHVSSVNVTNIAVHCQTPTIPTGLDLTFGDAGRVSTPVGGNGQGEGVVIQTSGQIVTAGWRTVGTGTATDFALTRHNSDGSLDTSFGAGGIVTTDLGGLDDQALDAALLPDSGIVAVGRTDPLGILQTAFGIVSYLPDGTLNRNFGGGGIVTTPIFGKGAVANAVAVQPDGKIVVAGFAIQASGINSDFVLARYNPDGTLDTSFDGDGIVTTDLGTQSDDARALVIQPDGRIIVAGTAGENIALARYLPDGRLDTTFGSGGFKITDLGFTDVATGVALTPDGKIVIAGNTIGAKLNNDFLLARYDADGTLDATFGTGGTVTTDLGDGDDFAENLTVDAKGRIILVGRATSPTILDMALARYKPDGTLDTSFDGDGILTADFHGRGEFGQDVALDPQGRIVAAGYTADGGDTEFALMRANP